MGGGFSLHANGSLNKAEAKDTGLQIGKAPKSTAALGVLYKDHGLYGSLIAKSTGSQYAKDGEPAAYKIGAYTVTNFTAGYRWKVSGSVVKAVKVQVGVDNVFNKQDVTSIAPNSKGVAFDQYTFVPERSWTFSMNADF